MAAEDAADWSRLRALVPNREAERAGNGPRDGTLDALPSRSTNAVCAAHDRRRDTHPLPMSSADPGTS